ncbi:hypothetical protein HHL19_00240 [Streptomyces sp. R302]|uniref:hypothetical protein n=1 Tax=unclassified Streptomyces TaxID=2593676 RepID=UPI00145C450A|nr:MULTISPECIES: hypothetical protein [unclassified Streptomyces]NML48803.1 hypothetical protein [Streptomyces sp. R301]NML77130.1 hypothetical protein [Streptomyces sp. R302]
MTTKVKRMRIWKVIASCVVAALFAGGVHLYFNTNAFGEGSFCGGALSADSAATAFARPGRLSEREGPRATGSGELDFDCIVESSSMLPSRDEQLHVQGTSEAAEFPFTEGRWPKPEEMAFFSQGATGAVSGDHGWVMLPESCWDGEPRIVEGRMPGGVDNPLALSRILVEAANRSVRAAGCAQSDQSAPTELAPIPKERKTDKARQCGVDGFLYRGPDTDVSEVAHEPGAGSGTWACTVRLKNRSAPSVERSGYLTYSVTRDPLIIAGIKKSADYSTSSPIPGWPVTGVDGRHIVANCGGTQTYFAMALGSQYLKTMESAGRVKDHVLFRDFVESVGKQFGCTGVAPAR